MEGRKRRKPLEEQLKVAQGQGATHQFRVDYRTVRVFRQRARSWQGRFLDGDDNDWIFIDYWHDFAGEPPEGAERIGHDADST